MNLFNNLVFQIRVLFRLIIRHKRLVFSSIFLVLIFIIFCYFTIIKRGLLLTDMLSEGIVGTFTQDNMPDLITNLMSRPLIVNDNKGLPEGDLVDSWQVNKEATKYIFTLKKNQYWQDGSLVKASDLDISLPDTKFVVLDDSHFELDLADSYSPLPTLLTNPVFKKGSLVGTGPYFVSRIDKDQVFIRKITLKSQDKNLPDVVIHFYPSESIAEEALKIGEVNSLLGMGDTSAFTNEAPFNVISAVDYTRLVAIFYNTKDSILSDRNFRLALSFAAPSIKGEKLAVTSIPPISWAFNPDVKDYLDNSNQAKQYLEKVTHGKDQPVTLTVITDLANVGQNVVDTWNKQGIKSVMRVESGVPQNFQALLIAYKIPVDPDQYSLWHSTQTKTNVSQYFSTNQYSPRVDKDLEDGRKTTDLDVRKQRYQDLQKVLLDDAPATPLYFAKYNVVYAKKVGDDLHKVLGMQLRGMQLNF